MFATGNKYRRVITQNLPDMGVPVGTSIIIDVYDVLDCFAVKDPGLHHAIKKLLCVGIRGHKTAAADIREAIDALERTLHREALTDGTNHGSPVESNKRSPFIKVGPGYSEAQSLVVVRRTPGVGSKPKARRAKAKTSKG